MASRVPDSFEDYGVVELCAWLKDEKKCDDDIIKIISDNDVTARVFLDLNDGDLKDLFSSFLHRKKIREILSELINPEEEPETPVKMRKIVSPLNTPPSSSSSASLLQRMASPSRAYSSVPYSAVLLEPQNFSATQVDTERKRVIRLAMDSLIASTGEHRPTEVEVLSAGKTLATEYQIMRDNPAEPVRENYKNVVGQLRRRMYNVTPAQTNRGRKAAQDSTGRKKRLDLTEGRKKTCNSKKGEGGSDSTRERGEADSVLSRDRGEADRDRSEAGRNRGEADRNRGEADRGRSEAGRNRGEADRNRGEADRDRSEAGRNRGEADRGRSEADRNRGEADRDRSEADRNRSEADRDRGEADRDRSEADRDRGEASTRDRSENRSASTRDKGEQEWRQAAGGDCSKFMAALEKVSPNSKKNGQLIKLTLEDRRTELAKHSLKEKLGFTIKKYPLFTKSHNVIVNMVIQLPENQNVEAMEGSLLNLCRKVVNIAAEKQMLKMSLSSLSNNCKMKAAGIMHMPLVIRGKGNVGKLDPAKSFIHILKKDELWKTAVAEHERTDGFYIVQNRVGDEITIIIMNKTEVVMQCESISVAVLSIIGLHYLLDMPYPTHLNGCLLLVQKEVLEDNIHNDDRFTLDKAQKALNMVSEESDYNM